MTMNSAPFLPRTVLGPHAVPHPKHQGKPQAVALSYETHAVAPKVLAKGEGLIAEAILARAREAGVPLHADPDLLTLLMQLEVDAFIPPALYGAIAEILVWAYALDEQLARASKPLG